MTSASGRGAAGEPLAPDDHGPAHSGRPAGGGRAVEVAAPLLKGRYALGSVVGRGGMATVYRAVDVTLQREVAVKVLHPHLSREPAFVDQFLEMERRIARLFHPHLVTMYDAGIADESCFVAMEYVPGGSLRDRLRTEGPLPVADVVRLVAQTAEALQVLHTERIVHGDIKPDNVLLAADGSAKLVDFGIAHLATTTGVIDPERLSGTTPYLAPEQVQHGRTDVRSDIYALGLVAYELLAGRPAFQGDHWIAVATQRLERDPDPLPRVRSDIPPYLEAAIRRATARDPERRFSSAEALRRALLGEGSLDDVSPPVGQPAGAPVQAIRDQDGTTRLAIRPVVARPVAAAAPAPPRDARATRPDRFRRALASVRPGRRALLPALVGGLLLLLLAGLLLPRLLNPPRPVRVPALTGQSLDMARGLARQAGLELAVVDEASESASRGSVLRQEPSANTVTQSDRPVRVVVSSGPPPVRVPNLGGRRVDDARRDLASLGLSLGKVDSREVTQPPFGSIVEQSARAGSDLTRGGAVDVVVGMPPLKNTPKLVDRALGDAEAELEKQGLRLGAVRTQAADGKRAGTVVAQDPPPDVKLRQGESVAVTIAVPASAGAVPSP